MPGEEPQTLCTWGDLMLSRGISCATTTKRKKLRLHCTIPTILSYIDGRYVSPIWICRPQRLNAPSKCPFLDNTKRANCFAGHIMAPRQNISGLLKQGISFGSTGNAGLLMCCMAERALAQSLSVSYPEGPPPPNQLDSAFQPALIPNPMLGGSWVGSNIYICIYIYICRA